MLGKIAMNGRANKVKTAFRLEYSAGINIKAKPDRVWELMTNAGEFPRWNSTIKSIEGTIAAGQTIKLVVTISPGRVFNLKIIEFDTMVGLPQAFTGTQNPIRGINGGGLP